jgi:hypothetical protein
LGGRVLLMYVMALHPIAASKKMVEGPRRPAGFFA